MPPNIKDDATEHPTVEDQLRKLWAEHPLPPRTGQRADKAFFDDLSRQTQCEGQPCEPALHGY